MLSLLHLINQLSWHWLKIAYFFVLFKTQNIDMNTLLQITIMIISGSHFIIMRKETFMQMAIAF